MSVVAVDISTARGRHNSNRDTFAAEELMVDAAVQRTVDQLWVRNRIPRFNPDALGVLVVSRRDGDLHIIDGQHRVELCRQAGYPHALECLVYNDLTLAEEASMFRVLNDRRKVNPIDLFRVRVVEGDPTATKLNLLLNEHGWTVQASKAAGAFSAVGAIEKVYLGWGPVPSANLGVCESVISVITEAWGHNAHGTRAEIVTGLGLLLVRHGRKVDLTKLVTEMASTSGGPLVLCGRAKALRDMSGGRIGDAMAANFINMLNKGRRSNRLPSWMEDM